MLRAHTPGSLVPSEHLCSSRGVLRVAQCVPTVVVVRLPIRPGHQAEALCSNCLVNARIPAQRVRCNRERQARAHASLKLSPHRANIICKLAWRRLVRCYLNVHVKTIETIAKKDLLETLGCILTPFFWGKRAGARRGRATPPQSFAPISIIMEAYQ